MNSETVEFIGSSMSDRIDPSPDQIGKKEDFPAPSAGSSEAGKTSFLI